MRFICKKTGRKTRCGVVEGRASVCLDGRGVLVNGVVMRVCNTGCASIPTPPPNANGNCPDLCGHPMVETEMSQSTRNDKLLAAFYTFAIWGNVSVDVWMVRWGI